MTVYTFKPTSSTQRVAWHDPTIWQGGVVPNSSDADVIFPAVTYAGTTTPYYSVLSILDGEAFSTRSIELRDGLELSGSLDVSGTLRAYSMDYPANGIQVQGGSLSVGTLINDAPEIRGWGTITVGELTNHSTLWGEGGVLTINATSVTQLGRLYSQLGSLSLNVAPGGSSALAAGTLTDGSLLAYTGGGISINAGSPLLVDAGTITLFGGSISSRDPVSGVDVPLESSLRTIAAAGTLNLYQGPYAFGSLDVAGTINLSQDYLQSTIFAASSLAVKDSGHLQGTGTVTAPIVNDGTITVTTQGSRTLFIDGPVTGQGTLHVAPALTLYYYHGSAYYESATLELGGASNETVRFESDHGVLQLDAPSSFTGAISATGSGDTVLLDGVLLSSVTGTSYVGDARGGTLTLQQAAGAVSLHFLGSYTAANFAITAGSQVLSSDPAYVQITVNGPERIDGRYGHAVAHDFDGTGTADILWQGPGGALTEWLAAGTAINENRSFQRQVASDWHVQGTGDFDGAGRVDILWRSDSGMVTEWLSSGLDFKGNDQVMRQVATDWHVAGIGDFNGDGRSDVLWRSDAGTVTDWLSDGVRLVDNAAATRTVATDWKIVGTGDFNGDGKADVLWRSDAGLVTDWLSTGTGFADNAGVSRQAGTDWRIVGTGDFDGNGKTDVLWQSASGDVTTWLSDGTGFLDNAASTRHAGSDWHIQGTGDFNGDGLTDVLWRSDAGLVTDWLSTGTGFADNADWTRYAAADWSIFHG